MPRIYILLMSVLISAFYACDHRGKPYPATLSVSYTHLTLPTT